MTKKEEIIRNYHCDDVHGEMCIDCKDCEKALADDLEDFEKEIRTDEKRKILANIYQEYKNACKNDRLAWQNGDLTADYVGNFWKSVEEQLNEHK